MPASLAVPRGAAGRVDMVQTCACLGGVAWRNRNHACVDPQLGRPEGHRPAEIVNVCGSPAWQALRAWSGSDSMGLRGQNLG
jgi:hypothetical protein